jgi:hypothetical protein
MTIAAARASSPDVGSSMNIIEGLATSSTAIVSRFLCSVDSPVLPGSPTKAFLKVVSSTRSITSFTKVYKKIQYSEFKNYSKYAYLKYSIAIYFDYVCII